MLYKSGLLIVSGEFNGYSPALVPIHTDLAYFRC